MEPSGPDLPIRVVLAGGGGIAAVLKFELLKGQPMAARNVLDVSAPEQLIPARGLAKQSMQFPGQVSA